MSINVIFTNIWHITRNLIYLQKLHIYIRIFFTLLYSWRFFGRIHSEYFWMFIIIYLYLVRISQKISQSNPPITRPKFAPKGQCHNKTKPWNYVPYIMNFIYLILSYIIMFLYTMGITSQFWLNVINYKSCNNKSF